MSAVLLIFFSGLITMVIYILDLVTNARVKLSALSAATERIEYIRSLPYDSVGTIAGIPSGPIPQQRLVTLNTYPLHERVLIEFFDDPADGQGAADSNSILADYKRVKIVYSWNVTGATSSVELISTIVPRSIETTAGGGSIRVNVFDAAVAPVSGASVRLLNTTGTSTIDVTRLTDPTGIALFAGAPANSNYQIFVTKPGYSTDQTYSATTSNPNPTVPPVTVLEADVTTMNFQIDRVSDLTIRAISTLSENSFLEPFDSMSGVATATNLVATGGNLVLQDTLGVFAASGTAWLPLSTPTPFERWEALSWVRVVPAGTEARVRFYTGSPTAPVLVPESDLPGNAVGFTERYIDLRDLDQSTYSSLGMAIELRTSNITVTPRVDQLSLYYRESATPLGGQNFTMSGQKVIGATAASIPIPKFVRTERLSSAGEHTFSDIEWDTYQLSFVNRGIRQACVEHPIALSPDTSEVVEVFATTVTSDNLRVSVVDSAGLPIPGALVRLSLGASWWSAPTRACGQVFFDGILADSGYSLEVSAPGFVTQNIPGVIVGGETVRTVTLTAL